MKIRQCEQLLCGLLWQVRMYEVINSIESETISYSFIMCDLLSTDTMKGKLFGAFRDRGIRVHMDVLVKTGVRFYATNPANIQKGMPWSVCRVIYVKKKKTPPQNFIAKS